MTGSITGGQVLPFRPRRPAVLRRRRNPWLRLLQPLALALLFVGGPGAAGLWLLTSKRLALERFEVDPGGDRVDPRWVERTLEPWKGANLVQLSLAGVDAALHRHPWIDRVDLRKQLPRTLEIRLHERRAAALLAEGGDLYYVDRAGAVIAPLDPTAPGEDLLLVSRRVPDPAGAATGAAPAAAQRPGDPVLGLADVAKALDFVDELARERPAWAAGLSELEIVGEEDFRILSTGVPFPVLARAGTLAEKAARLEPLVPDIVARYGSVAAVDLRFARRILIQPRPSLTDLHPRGAAPSASPLPLSPPLSPTA